MNDVAEHSGRPFGGVCIIARKVNQITYREIECLNDRVIAVGVYDQHSRLVQVLCNVYMPFYDGSSDNTEHFVETIDELQCLVDKYSSTCPIKFFGDFNANVPRNEPLNKKWYQDKGFNKHSLILYNFMLANNIVAVDRLWSQSVQYTYFCDKRKVLSWLDHVLCAQYDMQSVLECAIVKREADNDSDHLPIRTVFSIRNISDEAFKANVSLSNPNSRVSWQCTNVNAKYTSLLAEKLKALKPLKIDDTSTVEIAQEEAERYTRDLTQILHESATEAGGSQRKHFKPKPYWCPELSYMRDRKRFWWKLWSEAGRPRQGAVFDCYKGIKKMFRRLSRKCINNILQQSYSRFNNLYCNGRLSAFWRSVKNSHKTTVNSNLSVDSMASHFNSIMTDDGVLTEEQKNIASLVEGWYVQQAGKGCVRNIVNSNSISTLIDKLHSNCAPGLDGLTSEHLKYGKSDILCDVLSELFTCLMSWQIVPGSFQTGVIVPVLKKPSLNPNVVSSYRPITLSSVLSKMLEMLLLPKDNVSDTQFGFRKGRGTAFACTLFNDVKAYFENKKSPLFVCSLDAEKCFDSICHKSLFYKLWNRIPPEHWLLLYRWYSNLKALVRWNHCYSSCFKVTKGTRQGSLISPQLFNIFIDDLLQELGDSSHKVCIGPCSVNSFAYADDITVMSTTAPGLQSLVDKCSVYARRWRFKFGIKKTKCMIISGDSLMKEPMWYLNSERIENVESLEILGVQFDRKNKDHVYNRSEKCKRAFYSLRDVGMAYPGCTPNVKAYLWRTICQPVILYGFDSVNISRNSLHDLESVQSKLIKQSLGLSKRSRSSYLLQALNVTSVEERIKQNTASLLKRIYVIDSPVKNLTNYFLSMYISQGITYPGTIIQRVVSYGLSPTNCIFNKYNLVSQPDCGVVDSLRSLLSHVNFIKPYSEQHVLTSLLTRAF